LPLLAALSPNPLYHTNPHLFADGNVALGGASLARLLRSLGLHQRDESAACGVMKIVAGAKPMSAGPIRHEYKHTFYNLYG
jgi:hypothetical protein